MLQAMTTGHDGSLTTVHAKGPEDALRRIELLALMAGLELPHAAVREQVASAFDVVAQVARRSDGERRLRLDPRRRATRPGLAARPAARCRGPLQPERGGVISVLLSCVAAATCAASMHRAETAPSLFLRRIRLARCERALERELPDALRRVAAELGAGRTADRALLAAGNAHGAAGEAFALAGRRAAGGEDIGTALAAALGQRASFAAAAVSLQLRAGGDLPALLRSLARRLDERSGVNAEIRALTAQARLSARVVPLLPVAGLALAALLDAGAVRLLLTTAPGLAIVAVSCRARPRRPAHDPLHRTGNRLSAALAGLAVVLLVAGLRPRRRVVVWLALVAACAVTMHELGGPAGVVEGAAVGAALLAVRRRGLLAQGAHGVRACGGVA